jgi:hypothetical protein
MKPRLLAMCAFLAGASLFAIADPIPYPNVGTIAPQASFTASSTGNITGYFVGQSAAADDSVRMVDLTHPFTSAWLFPNHATAIGATANFGPVTAGDVLVFEILSGQILASNPTYSQDSLNHAYATAFVGGTLDGTVLPSGIYIGMEDMFGGGDRDYNDLSFLVTNVGLGAPTTSSVPEPTSLLLFGSGLIGVAGVFRKRIFA